MVYPVKTPPGRITVEYSTRLNGSAILRWELVPNCPASPLSKR